MDVNEAYIGRVTHGQRAAITLDASLDRGPAVPVQAAVTEFMRRGLLAAHIRRARTEYARRRLAVLDALARHCPAVAPLSAPGGLHMVLRLPPDTDEAATAREARGRGLNVAPFGAYHLETPAFRGLVVGFASTPVPLAADAARRLAASLR